MPDKRYIAIVDDHTMFRKGMAALISLFPNYEVLFDASGGNELIEQLNPQQLPDIILMDINMPNMDGYAATEWVHSHYPEIKVLALSTMDAESAIIKMIKCGAKGYIMKHADPSELKLAFDEVLRIGYFYNETVSRKVMASIKELTESNNNALSFTKLTTREIEFLKLNCTELSYKEIADKMFVSARTIDGYREAICEKLGLKSRVGLAIYAIKNNIA